MEVSWTVLLIIIGGAVVTFIPRVIPIMILSRMKLSEGVQKWLYFVPIAILAAIVGQELFIQNNEISLSLNKELLAAIVTVFIAISTRSLLWTVISGVTAFVLVRWLFSL
ncbi:AzlD domain-containing protein [Niallia taxi]|uniref:AzlD domain-containing protein n=1 Tax=Niallia taxi TaxID=2499688 RepID=UPI0021A8EC5B|nr:AzlD domain-containing protein [Niallia taxi]MCT2345482.1 AzlD domain-containing protein [Niallia taxi]MDE5052759.1 AzlD domain-containing protein [Niallia taxi]MED3963128.1 AzlD domain-containing protein [Niallia taxi]WOD65402.1 AzlD domain-containing protein [Niallia taxi]